MTTETTYTAQQMRDEIRLNHARMKTTYLPVGGRQTLSGRLPNGTTQDGPKLRKSTALTT